MPEIVSLSPASGPSPGDLFIIRGLDFGFTKGVLVFAPHDSKTDAARQLFSGAQIASWTDFRIALTTPATYHLTNQYLFVVDAQGITNPHGFFFTPVVIGVSSIEHWHAVSVSYHPLRFPRDAQVKDWLPGKH